MTEKGGGSDVGGGTDTYAEKIDESNVSVFFVVDLTFIYITVYSSWI